MAVIFLPIESTRRELDYKLNLARLFCNKGLDVVLGNPPFIRDELKYKNYQAIFLEKGINPEPAYYKHLVDKGTYLYDLSDEGAAEPVYSINYQPAIDALMCVRSIFLWGRKQKLDLLERNSDAVLSKKYEIIGNPAFDLCDPKYKRFHKALKPIAFPDTYILINTNFGCFQSHTIEEHLEACKLMSPLTLKMIQNSYIKEEKEFEVFHVWLEAIFKSFPNENFVIRPHPSEKLENYQHIFGKYKNVSISKAGNANQAIASAKMVLHKDCTTAMQSYLMGVPVISLGGNLLYSEYVQWPLAFSVLPQTVEDAKELIQLVCLKGAWNKELQLQIDEKAKEVVASFFYNLGKSSNALVEFITKDARDLIKNQKPYILTDSRTVLQKLKLFVRKFLPLHYKISKATRETLIRISKKEILARLSLFETIDPLEIEFNVKELFPNAFSISKKGKFNMRIAVFGWYGHNNAGDERIKGCLQSFLQEQAGVKSVEFYDLHENASKGKTNKFDHYELVIIGGGGLILSQCNYHDFINNINTKVVTIGISVEHPVLTGNAKKFAIALLDKSLAVLVRDQDSANKLSHFDLQKKVKVSHDLTFLKPFETVPYIHENRIGINLLPKPLDMKYSTLCNTFLSFLLRQLNRFNVESVVRIMDFKNLIQALNRQYELLPIPLYCEAQQLSVPLYHKNDVEFLKLYFKDVPSQFFEENFNNCALILSMRLHAAIFAVQKGIPVLSLSYLPKNRNFMRQVGLEEYVFDSIELKDVNRTMDNILDKQHIIREKMKVYTETATLQVRKDLIEILNLVN